MNNTKMITFPYLGPSINDVTHLGGGGICQKVMLLHKPISKIGDKGEGGVKNLKKWATSFVDGSLGQLRKDAPHLSFGFW